MSAAPSGRHYDSLEVRDPGLREREQFARLADHIRHAKANTPYFARLLKDVDPAEVRDRAQLAGLPITRKSSLVELQKAEPPLGGLNAVAPGKLARVFQSPGPTYDAEGFGRDWWRTARAFFAAGFRAGDIIHNTFAYHFTPAGAMMEAGAHALGCAVFPAGGGQTELQVRAIADIRPIGYAGTPSFLKIILAMGRETGADLSSLKRALVAGEALPAALRAELSLSGIDIYQCYASADLGLIGYESEAREGFIVEEGLIVEIVRPGTGDPVVPGEVGEVVATLFASEYPLIRFATGDLSAVLPGTSPCGRTGLRLKGWMGRADQTTKVRGMFVHPAQIADVLRRHPEIKKARLVVDQDDGKDAMTLLIEGENSPAGLGEKIAATIQAVCKLRGGVAFVAPGSLANDGRVIEDKRKIT
ncbi:MAG: phenylacetate--CoA ligase family protein [Rhodospirillales bacterium]|nr:phenylacetate--CoA ligase family protein [Rhodospirillales bacterium]MSP81125.1 phenylacetate--CoA ligase family protein [Rhodospirillales bacterium]